MPVRTSSGSSGSSGVHVALRVRPPTSHRQCLHLNSEAASVGVTDGPTFYAEKVFGSDAQQSEMHPFCVKTAIGRVIEGVNSAVMVYGQTGSGKTFTMEGTTEEPGVSQQAFSALFQKIRQVQLSSVKAGNGDSVTQFHVRVSYVQIYMERVSDLLSAGSR